jgi:hypothetical protein
MCRRGDTAYVYPFPDTVLAQGQTREIGASDFSDVLSTSGALFNQGLANEALHSAPDPNTVARVRIKCMDSFSGEYSGEFRVNPVLAAECNHFLFLFSDHSPLAGALLSLDI